ncbi:hypothetical protein CDAR_534511 [Caerostris darwini]|uniref:Uncharacterized protein n=1 Tax=Caerostris darwini TaxID=1538125 RepID=A0AAV4MGP2_9ARAC|nr:hypothetical protein CDAR_534511 [Caerostris darwini]
MSSIHFNHRSLLHSNLSDEGHFSVKDGDLLPIICCPSPLETSHSGRPSRDLVTDWPAAGVRGPSLSTTVAHETRTSTLPEEGTVIPNSKFIDTAGDLGVTSAPMIRSSRGGSNWNPRGAGDLFHCIFWSTVEWEMRTPVTRMVIAVVGEMK